MGKSISKKKMCKISRGDIEGEYDKYVEMTNDPDYVCKKCNRTARQEKSLCKAKKIKPRSRDE